MLITLSRRGFAWCHDVAATVFISVLRSENNPAQIHQQVRITARTWSVLIGPHESQCSVMIITTNNIMTTCSDLDDDLLLPPPPQWRWDARQTRQTWQTYLDLMSPVCAGLMLVCRNVVEHNNHHHHSQSSLAHQSSASPPLRHSVNNDQRSKVKPVETLVLDHSSLRYPQSLSPSVLLRQLIIKLI